MEVADHDALRTYLKDPRQLYLDMCVASGEPPPALLPGIDLQSTRPDHRLFVTPQDYLQASQDVMQYLRPAIDELIPTIRPDIAKWLCRKLDYCNWRKDGPALLVAASALADILIPMMSNQRINSELSCVQLAAALLHVDFFKRHCDCS